MEVALRELLPRLLKPEVVSNIRVFQGKQDLLNKLPQRLLGYASWIDSAQVAVAVLIDEDREDCRQLKQQLEAAALHAGLRTVTTRPGDAQVLNRIVIEELEAWFFGDVAALRSAYPRIPTSLATRAAYRYPDAVAGGTAEALERVLQKAGYHRAGLRKTVCAADVSPHLTPALNSSTSFGHFWTGLQRLGVA